MNPDLVTGVVLAGGKSARMGADKASMIVDGKQMVDYVVDALGSIFREIVVVTKGPSDIRVIGARLVSDAVPGYGPLVGIYTALSVSNTPYCFVTACDMPFVNPRLVELMLLKCDGCDAVVPKIGPNFEPLFALYSKTCMKPIRESLDKEDYRVRNLFPKVRLVEVGESDIRTVDPEMRSFTNVNTERDLKDFKEHLSKGP